jgi:hypothetical protein
VHRTYGSEFSSICDSAKGGQKPENISSDKSQIGVKHESQILSHQLFLIMYPRLTTILPSLFLVR